MITKKYPYEARIESYFKINIIPYILLFPGQEFGDRTGTIVGWGRMGVEKSASKVLLKASLKILTDESCMESRLAKHLTPTMMCAFSKGKDGCQVTQVEFQIVLILAMFI